jgi:phenylacetate-CoA ligase
MRAGIKVIDLIRGTNILDKYEYLKSTAADSNSHNVNDKLAQFLINIKNSNEYYKPLLSKFNNDEIFNSPLSVLKSLPIIDKKTIDKNYSSVFTPLKGKKVQKKKTGGSTGSPFYYYVDSDHLSWFWAYIYFFWNRFAEYTPGDPFITIAGNSLRTNNRRFIESVYHGLQNNYFLKGDIIEPSMYIDYNKTNKAKILYGYPSSIINIIKVKPVFLKNVSNLTAIFTTSEQLLPQTRIAIETALKLPVFDMYGANDGGILTCECQSKAGYHINTHNCFVETFNNEYGMSELLLTNLNSMSFPFVRYRVGDLGKIVNERCSCGLSWPRVVELKGRTRDLIILPNGNTIHGSFFNSVFYKHPLIDAYKILQQKDRSIVIYLHIKTPDKFDEISESVLKEVKDSLGEVSLSVEKLSEMNPTNEKFKLIESHAI